MSDRDRPPRVVVTRDYDTPPPPRAVAVLLMLVNLGMAAAVVFVLTQIDNAIAYVAGAPLVLVFLVTGTTYAYALLFRRADATSRSPSRGSRGSRSP